MTRLNWTPRERKENRMMVEMLLEKALIDQKNEHRTTKQFFDSIVLALGSLTKDDMVTDYEAVQLITKYMMLYDPNWRVPTTEEEFEQFKRDYPIGGREK